MCRPRARAFRASWASGRTRTCPAWRGWPRASMPAAACRALQLQHSGRRADPELTGQQPCAPWDDAETGARALSTAEVEQLVAGLHRRRAARRARRLPRRGAARRARLPAGAVSRCRAQPAQRPLRRQLRQPQPHAVRDHRRHPRRAPGRASSSACGCRPSASASRMPEALALAQAGAGRRPARLPGHVAVGLLQAAAGPGLCRPAADRPLRRRCRAAAPAWAWPARSWTPPPRSAAWTHGADFVLIGRGAMLHHDFARRALADPAFRCIERPVSRAHLAGRGPGPGVHRLRGQHLAALRGRSLKALPPSTWANSTCCRANGHLRTDTRRTLCVRDAPPGPQFTCRSRPCQYGARSARRRILPVGLRGSSAITSTLLGTLKPAMRSRAQAITLAGSTRVAGPRHAHRLHRLAPGGVGHADHRHVGHVGVAVDRALDLGRVDVLAAGDDHVLHPVVDVDVAVGVHVAGVAGVHPAVGGLGAGGGLGLLPVAQHVVRRAGDDLAHLAGGQRSARRRRRSSSRRRASACRRRACAGCRSGRGPRAAASPPCRWSRSCRRPGRTRSRRPSRTGAAAPAGSAPRRRRCTSAG